MKSIRKSKQIAKILDFSIYIEIENKYFSLYLKNIY